MSAKRVKFARKVVSGSTASGTPMEVRFVASKARGNFVAVNMGWRIGSLQHESERIFGPLETQDVFGQVNKWVGKICRQVGVSNNGRWRKTMDRTAVAKELVRLAKAMVAIDRDLDLVAKIVKTNEFLGLRGPLHLAGFKKVDFDHQGGAHWTINARGGKKIVVTHKSNADAGAGDVVVGDFVVGYL